MKVALNLYYIKQLQSITRHIEVSKGGNKQFLPPLKNENDYTIIIDRTTYPDYIRFFFLKPPKNSYLEFPYKEGYYNGNRRELLRILNNLILGRVNTERLSYFLGDLFYNYHYYIKDFEEEHNEKYFFWDNEDFEEIPL